MRFFTVARQVFQGLGCMVEPHVETGHARSLLSNGKARLGIGRPGRPWNAAHVAENVEIGAGSHPKMLGAPTMLVSRGRMFLVQFPITTCDMS